MIKIYIKISRRLNKIFSHVYLVFYHDWLEGRGEVSSMFGGYKFVCDERLKVAKDEVEVKNEEEIVATK